jgi:hypothetical protein
MVYLALDRGSTYSKLNEADILLRQGKKTETLERIRELNDAFGLRLVESCLKGRPPTEIESLSKDFHNLAASIYDPEFSYVAAQYEAVCGREQDAIGFLRKAVEGNFCSYPALDSDPLFSPLRHTTEFQEIRSAAMDCQKKFLAYRNEHPQ